MKDGGTAMGIHLEALLRDGVERRASDIHLCVEQPPVFRIDGSLKRQGETNLTVSDLNELARAIMPLAKLEELQQQGEVDFSVGLSGVGRFRVNIYRSRGSLAMALRAIPFQVKSMQELGLPQIVAELAKRPKGLVLVTGPTGSGKSTTLAAMLDLINSERECHILTMEDPIEYLHRHKKAVINQREVGTDTQSFSRGLRSALREDPDVILVGEMRDLDTISIGLEAAETGHLVFATLHTNDAPAAIDRLIDVFPEGAQEQVRIQVATVLEGVIAQLLLPRADGPGRVAVQEILVVTPAVRNLIREHKTHQIVNVIQMGGKLGMQSMASGMKHLYEQGVIRWEHYAPYAEKEGADPQAAAGRDPVLVGRDLTASGRSRLTGLTQAQPGVSPVRPGVQPVALPTRPSGTSPFGQPFGPGAMPPRPPR